MWNYRRHNHLAGLDVLHVLSCRQEVNGVNIEVDQRHNDVEPPERIVVNIAMTATGQA
jgi:hypothetical protein